MYSTQLRNIRMEVFNAENSTGGQETKQAKARMDLTRNEHDRKNDVNETIGHQPEFNWTHDQSIGIRVNGCRETLEQLTAQQHKGGLVGSG